MSGHDVSYSIFNYDIYTTGILLLDSKLKNKIQNFETLNGYLLKKYEWVLYNNPRINTIEYLYKCQFRLHRNINRLKFFYMDIKSLIIECIKTKKVSRLQCINFEAMLNVYHFNITLYENTLSTINRQILQFKNEKMMKTIELHFVD
jgi:hypothetical protein